jgi:hypothetical protein
MVTERQVRKLMKLIQSEETLTIAAAKSGMDEKTARKYRRLGQLPSQCQQGHSWRTRQDPFADLWEELQELLQLNPGLEAKTIFADLQRRYPGRFQDGQLRTLQRKVKSWRVTEGPPKEVFFPQDYQPGRLCQSDFTHLTKLRVLIRGEAFSHLLYHFVLPYSNWETGTVCFSESYESLSAGLQNALWELGGVPIAHQSDRLSAAVNNYFNPEAFTRRYQALLRHYGLQGRMIQTGQAHANGDIEQRHYRFKQALEQALLLRGHRDFDSRAAYEAFLQKLFKQLNRGRQARLREELQVLRHLPVRRMDDAQKERLRVGPSSTIRVKKTTYCVDSRLIVNWLRCAFMPSALKSGTANNRSTACRAYPDTTSTTSTTAISSILRSASLAPLRIIVTGRNSFPPATSGWLMICSENRIVCELTKNT